MKTWTDEKGNQRQMLRRPIKMTSKNRKRKTTRQAAKKAAIKEQR